MARAYANAAYYTDRYSGRMARLPAPVRFLKNVAQGACAGLLTFVGAYHLTHGAPADATLTAGAMNPETWKLIADKILYSGAPGVVEIVGAAAMFFNAGAGWARILGLFGFIGLVVAHANGVTPEDAIPYMAELYDTVPVVLEKLRALGFITG
ncbi:MAG: hypothetical protein AAF850_10670 [Pseudomonadota bacterium]